MSCVCVTASVCVLCDLLFSIFSNGTLFLFFIIIDGFFQIDTWKFLFYLGDASWSAKEESYRRGVGEEEAGLVGR